MAAWLSYLVILAPNSGIIRNNCYFIAADRYGYMAMLGSVMVASACFCWVWNMSSRWHSGISTVLIAIGLGALLVLSSMTRNQCRTWLNSETLWTHALSHGEQNNCFVHAYLGDVLHSQKKYGEAEAHFAEALRLKPDLDQAQSASALQLW